VGSLFTLSDTWEDTLDELVSCVLELSAGARISGQRSGAATVAQRTEDQERP
jgi:hypothetical protein